MTLLSVDLGPKGSIFVEYACDRCGQRTIEHPSLVVHPVKPYSVAAPQRHECEPCVRMRARPKNSSAPALQLVLGGKRR